MAVYTCQHISYSYNTGQHLQGVCTEPESSTSSIFSAAVFCVIKLPLFVFTTYCCLSWSEFTHLTSHLPLIKLRKYHVTHCFHKQLCCLLLFPVLPLFSLHTSMYSSLPPLAHCCFQHHYFTHTDQRSKNIQDYCIPTPHFIVITKMINYFDCLLWCIELLPYYPAGIGYTEESDGRPGQCGCGRRSLHRPEPGHDRDQGTNSPSGCWI